jgi:abortive infection bacteriophage resistance protein
LNGNSKGKYIDLDFAYLQELSTIDMHLRNLITKMCIDIEHDLKVALLKDLENNTSEDGYSVVENFLKVNPYIIRSIEATSTSPFTGNLVYKYFDIQKEFNTSKHRYENKIRRIDCPVWVLLELLTFGDFICFYEYYYATKGQLPISTGLINLVKSLRNGCAHNNCIIADLNPGASKTPPEISRSITNMSDITKSQRKKKLSCRVILEFVCMLHIYDQVVSVNVKNKRVTELKDLFAERVIEKGIFYEKIN